MPKSRQRSIAVATDGALCAVLFDVMNTLVTAIGSWAELLARVYSEEAGIRVSSSQALAANSEVHSRPRDRTGNPDEAWAQMNREILAILSGRREEDIDLAVARRIRPRITGDLSLYEVRPEMRRLVEKLSERVLLGLATTEPWDYLQKALDLFALRPYFDPEAIFSSDCLGLYKADGRFWEKVRQFFGCENPRQIALVGDTWTDAAAANYGHPVALYGEYNGDSPLVKRCMSIADIEKALEEFGLP